MLFVILFWCMLFFGAAPTAALNGIAIAAAPSDAAHYASSIQVGGRASEDGETSTRVSRREIAPLPTEARIRRFPPKPGRR